MMMGWIMVAFVCRACLSGQIFVHIEIGSSRGRRVIAGTELLLLALLLLLTVIIDLAIHRVFIIHSNPIIVIVVYQVVQWIMNAKVFAYELLLL